jgi:hypothetical protein
MADRWSAKLARPIVMRDGTKRETLAEAGAFVLALPTRFGPVSVDLRAARTCVHPATIRVNLSLLAKMPRRRHRGGMAH